MGLRDVPLKEEYRSDRDDIVSEFFIPCLSNCIEYDRCIEFVSVKSLTTLNLGFDQMAKKQAKLRIICGHRFKASDLELLSKLFGEGKSDFRLDAKFIKRSKIQMLKDIVENHKLEIKIAIPSSEEVVGSFSERIGIFLDENDEAVAFTGTSNETFDAQFRNFESVDVFTSWNDKSRVDTKIKDFEKLWEDKTESMKVYDFSYAEKNNLLKFSTQWALDIA